MRKTSMPLRLDRCSLRLLLRTTDLGAVRGGKVPDTSFAPTQEVGESLITDSGAHNSCTTQGDDGLPP